jgi:hypothetical protein
LHCKLQPGLLLFDSCYAVQNAAQTMYAPLLHHRRLMRIQMAY